jgi:predicted nucleic acid-binding protein
VDTGAWFASIVASDANHAAATEWLAQDQGPLVTTDYVVSETLTLLVMRRQRRQAESFGNAIFSGQLARLHVLTLQEILAAWNVFLRFDDKQWSFTDCTSKLIIEKLRLNTAFSFDNHFRQFGTVTVVP